MPKPNPMQELIDIALEARQHAYAPYSDFQVGAAVLTPSGQIFQGCNVENASFGLAICAERSAVCSMVAAQEREIQAIAVASLGGVTPCGACRQVLCEFAKDCPVWCVDATNLHVRTWSLGELLPGVFHLD